MHVEDALRALMSEQTEYTSLNQIVHSVAVSDTKRQQIIEATAKDPILIELKRLYQTGWPSDKTKVTPAVRYYWKHKSKIFVENNLLFIEHAIIIPTSMRKVCIQKAYDDAHFGINRTLNRAKEVMFWPGMTEEIIEAVATCTISGKYQRFNTKEPLLAHEVPTAPFEKIARGV